MYTSEMVTVSQWTHDSGAYYAIPPNENMILVSAWNGNWDLYSFHIIGIARQNGNALVLFNAQLTTGKKIVIDYLWMRI